jgi:hypothetical protein
MNSVALERSSFLPAEVREVEVVVEAQVKGVDMERTGRMQLWK